MRIIARRTLRAFVEGRKGYKDQAALIAALGSRSRASEILSRRRALTVDMIHKIGEAWKIPADPLGRPYKVDSAA